MIKAAGHNDQGEHCLFLGLAEENVLRLKNNLPIIVRPTECRIPWVGEIIIGYARTERDFETIFQRNGALNKAEQNYDPRAVAHADLAEQEAKVLVLTVGLPRSGKSTWAKTQAYPIVCPDEIRTALHGHAFIAEAEPFVWAICKVMVRALFGSGHQFVILDATSITKKRRDEWRSSEWASRFKYFEADKTTCQDRADAAGDSALGPIIARMAEQFEPLAEDEPLFD